MGRVLNRHKRGRPPTPAVVKIGQRLGVPLTAIGLLGLALYAANYFGLL